MKIIASDSKSELAQAALAYAREGLRVLPCVPGGKTPLIGDWPRRATSDPLIVAWWWRRWPQANIGLVTGAPGYDVLDVDVRPSGDGLGTLARLQAAGLVTEPMKLVRTPSGGQHWYFRGTEQRKGKLTGQFVDFMATGGYVLAPPSRINIDGHPKAYELIRQSQGGGERLDWARVTSSTSPPGEITRRAVSVLRGSNRTLLRYLRRAPVGERNNRLFMVANRLIEAGQDPWCLVAEATALGLDEREARETINSALRTSLRGGGRG